MPRRILPLLLLSCLSEHSGVSNTRVGVDPDGVRLIGEQSSCDILRDCCAGDLDCLDFVSGLTEANCTDLLEGQASECVGNGCCQPNDPCGWADDGVCDCRDEFWDFSDCGGGEGEAEAEAEAEPDCCDANDPCDWADDGWCDCPGVDWDANDCEGGEGEAEAE